MGIETEYDDNGVPVRVSQTAGERSAQQFTLNLGTQSLSVITRSAFVSGLSLALCVVCAGVCWWAITENRVMIANYTRVQEQNDVMKQRLTKLENPHE